jgi:hypothetical protein
MHESPPPRGSARQLAVNGAFVDESYEIRSCRTHLMGATHLSPMPTYRF